MLLNYARVFPPSTLSDSPVMNSHFYISGNRSDAFPRCCRQCLSPWHTSKPQRPQYALSSTPENAGHKAAYLVGSRNMLDRKLLRRLLEIGLALGLGHQVPHLSPATSTSQSPRHHITHAHLCLYGTRTNYIHAHRCQLNSERFAQGNDRSTERGHDRPSLGRLPHDGAGREGHGASGRAREIGRRVLGSEERRKSGRSEAFCRPVSRTTEQRSWY